MRCKNKECDIFEINTTQKQNNVNNGNGEEKSQTVEYNYNEFEMCQRQLHYMVDHIKSLLMKNQFFLCFYTKFVCIFWFWWIWLIFSSSCLHTSSFLESIVKFCLEFYGEEECQTKSQFDCVQQWAAATVKKREKNTNM